MLNGSHALTNQKPIWYNNFLNYYLNKKPLENCDF